MADDGTFLPLWELLRCICRGCFAPYEQSCQSDQCKAACVVRRLARPAVYSRQMNLICLSSTQRSSVGSLRAFKAGRHLRL